MPKYDVTFSQDAVRCWLDSGKTAHVAAVIGLGSRRIVG